MILRFLDLIRKWKKDLAIKEINWDKLENQVKEFDIKNNQEWEKLKILKERSNLENEKLKIEIAKLKKYDLFFTSENQAIRISEIEYISHLKKGEYYRLKIKDSKDFLWIQKNEVEEIKKQIEKLKKLDCN